MKGNTIFRSIARKVYRSLETARFCHRITPAWRPGFISVFSRASRICRQRRFLPAEAFRLGLFVPGFDHRLLNDFISRKALTKIQKRLNPEASSEIAKNKGRFHSHCVRSGLPVPRLFIICTGPARQWQSQSAGILETRKQKEQFVRRQLPDAFVVKPLYGAYGKGVVVFNRQGRGFVDHCGKNYSPAGLLEFTESAYPTGLLIQEKIENHPAIVTLTGCVALQTVRIITFVARDRNVRVIHSHFKPITKQGIVIDTYLEGLAGNVEVPVESESGILGEGNQIVSTGAGIIQVACHPFTGRAFAGFELPMWQDVCRIVKHAAAGFLPLRTIGWDVAIAPNKIYIIEGNIWWDPPNQHKKAAQILEQMQDQPITEDNEPAPTDTRSPAVYMRG